MAGRAAPIFAGTHELMSSRDCSSRRTTAPVASIQLIAGLLPFCVALWVAPLSATFTHFSLPFLVTPVTHVRVPANIQSLTWEILRSSTPGGGRPLCAPWCARMFCCHFWPHADLLSPLSATFCRTFSCSPQPSHFLPI